MSCEQAMKKMIEAHTAYHAKVGELNDLLLSWVGPVVFDDDRFDDLKKEAAELHERFRATEAAFVEVKKRHRD
jgi:hypothetical protein